jgi:RNA polymerase sigma-70 factor (ECF subfamily)
LLAPLAHIYQREADFCHETVHPYIASVMDERDPEAFRALYRAHYGTVCRYLAARADRSAVEDVAAETFLVAWRRQAELPPHIVPWLLNTAAKCLANARRGRERSDALALRLAGVLPASSPGVDAELESRAHRRALVAALVAVGERDRELLLLRFWDGLAPREIAAVVGVSPVTMRARLLRAGRRLERELRVALAVGDPSPLSIPEVA